jgi:hypothetical protein
MATTVFTSHSTHLVTETEEEAAVRALKLRSSEIVKYSMLHFTDDSRALPCCSAGGQDTVVGKDLALMLRPVNTGTAQSGQAQMHLQETLRHSDTTKPLAGSGALHKGTCKSARKSAGSQ